MAKSNIGMEFIAALNTKFIPNVVRRPAIPYVDNIANTVKTSTFAVSLLLRNFVHRINPRRSRHREFSIPNSFPRFAF